MEDEAARGVPVRAQSMPAAAAMPQLREQLGRQYNIYLNSKSGELAVDAAANNQVLRRAENLAASPSYRYYTTPTASGGFSGSRTPAEAKATSNVIEQQAMRFASGRAFYQNGSQWIDNQIQKASNASTNRIQFNSDAYFAFAAKNPSLNSILSLGSNIQFVHKGQVIEIHE
jgi:hypothetical protein